MIVTITNQGGSSCSIQYVVHPSAFGRLAQIRLSRSINLVCVSNANHHLIVVSAYRQEFCTLLKLLRGQVNQSLVLQLCANDYL